jgi:2-polyprenyl-3-methyl-5-hydroxy-6-metoxy-1,4-benzoquinol methylase
MSKQMETAQSYWDARSELFANYYIKPSLFDRVFRKAVYGREAAGVKACSETPGAKVLDVGSGPGLNSISLIKNAKASHVTGIDFAENMIEFSQNAAKKEGLASKTNFFVGNMLTHDFGSQKFDFSMALGVFDYTKDADVLIKKMSELTTKSFVISWPENGLRMWLRRYRYTCPLYHYDLQKIKNLHVQAGIKPEKLEVINVPGGWVTIARK